MDRNTESVYSCNLRMRAQTIRLRPQPQSRKMATLNLSCLTWASDLEPEVPIPFVGFRIPILSAWKFCHQCRRSGLTVHRSKVLLVPAKAGNSLCTTKQGSGKSTLLLSGTNPPFRYSQVVHSR